MGTGDKILSKKKRENTQFDKEKSTNLFKDGDKTSTDKAANLLTNEPGILKEGGTIWGDRRIASGAWLVAEGRLSQASEGSPASSPSPL